MNLLQRPTNSAGSATDVALGPLPNFLILGAQKCGTTTLAANLRKHPEVFLPLLKEAQHFGQVQDSEAGGAAYRSFFGEWQGEPFVGEATPSYLYRGGAARQIARTLPKARFVVTLRNPVDRAYSAYWHAVREGRYRLTFADVLVEEPRKLAAGDWGWSSLVDTGRYLRQLLRYERLVGRERIHVVLFDDLVGERSRETLDGVAEFLGLSCFDWSALPPLNVNRKSWLPTFARRRLADARRKSPMADRVFRTTMRPFQPPPMSPFIRRALVEEFRVENELLGCWLDRDLSSWNR